MWCRIYPPPPHTHTHIVHFVHYGASSTVAWWQLDGSADNYRENSTVPIVPLPTWRVASMTREMVMLNKTSTTPLVPLRAFVCCVHSFHDCSPLDLWHLPPVSWCVVYWAALALRDTVICELAINIVELTNKQENKTIRCTTTSESWMIGVELEHWLWYRSVLVSLEPYNFRCPGLVLCRWMPLVVSLGLCRRRCDACLWLLLAHCVFCFCVSATVLSFALILMLSLIWTVGSHFFSLIIIFSSFFLWALIFFSFSFFSSPLCVCQECACAKSLIVHNQELDVALLVPSVR